MKDIIKTIFLFIIMLILLGAIIIVGIAVYIDLTQKDGIESIKLGNSTIAIEEPTEETSVSTANRITDIISGLLPTNENKKEEIIYSSENSTGKYFYEQLNENQKLIYNGLQQNKENMYSGDYVIHYGDKFTNILEQENGDKILGQDYQTAVEAYIYDNPDTFYLDINKLYLNVETTTKAWSKKYNVFVGPANNGTYYCDGFQNEEQVKMAMSKIDSVKNYIASKMTNNAYNDVKYIHDYLIDTIEYDESCQGIGAYSVYGALIEHKCVCEGYAEAFKYLCNSVGIDCEIYQGKAINSENRIENHEWNGVKIGNNWYYVDATWDDPIIVGNGIVLKSVHYKYFLKGKSSFEQNHTMSTQFSDGGKEFEFPQINQYDY